MPNPARTGVILAVRVHVAPAVRERFMPLMLANRDGARTAEPGCLRYDVFQDFDDSDCILVIEEYADHAALAAHRESPHYLAWAEFAASLPEGTITRARWTGVEPYAG